MNLLPRDGQNAAAPFREQSTLSQSCLVKNEYVLWQHQYRHAGDHPDYANVVSLVAAA
jgi:hypothetical protein